MKKQTSAPTEPYRTPRKQRNRPERAFLAHPINPKTSQYRNILGGRRLNITCRFASLPEEARARYEHPPSSFNFGWSHGKEMLEAGRPDLAKGSFYANPCFDAPFGDGGGGCGGEAPAAPAAEAVERYPSFAHPNVWPDRDVPGFSSAFKRLGQAVVRVGELVARQCDKCVGRWGGAGQGREAQGSAGQRRAGQGRAGQRSAEQEFFCISFGSLFFCALGPSRA